MFSRVVKTCPYTILPSSFLIFENLQLKFTFPSKKEGGRVQNYVLCTLIPSKLQICKFWRWIMFEKQGHRKLVDSNQMNGDYNIKVIRNYDHGDNYLNDKILLFHHSIITLSHVNAVNYHLYLALLQYWWPIIPKHQVSCPLKILQFFLKLI